MSWVICILLFSAVDGSLISEIHGKTLMSLEECNTAIAGKIEKVHDGVAVYYQCHREGTSS